MRKGYILALRGVWQTNPGSLIYLTLFRFSLCISFLSLCYGSLVDVNGLVFVPLLGCFGFMFLGLLVHLVFLFCGLLARAIHFTFLWFSLLFVSPLVGLNRFLLFCCPLKNKCITIIEQYLNLWRKEAKNLKRKDQIELTQPRWPERSLSQQKIIHMSFKSFRPPLSTLTSILKFTTPQMSYNSKTEN